MQQPFKEAYFNGIQRGPFERGLIDRAEARLKEGHRATRVTLVAENMAINARDFLHRTAQEGLMAAGLDNAETVDGGDIRVRHYVWRNANSAYGAIALAETIIGLEEAVEESKVRGASEGVFSVNNLAARVNFTVGPVLPPIEVPHPVLGVETVEGENWRKITDSVEKDGTYADLFTLQEREDGSKQLKIVGLIPGLESVFERTGPYPVGPITSVVGEHLAPAYKGIAKAEELQFSWEDEKPVEEVNRPEQVLSAGVFADLNSILSSFGD